MKTKAVRLYGEKDVRLEEFELPQIKDDEMLVKIITNSLCLSTYKLVQQGNKHNRITKDLAKNPSIIGHELCGVIIEVGKDWKDLYSPGMKFTVQPEVVVNNKSTTVGYNYPYYGGDSTYSILPGDVIRTGGVIPFHGESFFEASLSEPISCVIAGYHRMYHTSHDSHIPMNNIKKNGYLIAFGTCGPMGLSCLDYALQIEDGPKLIVAVDIDPKKIERAKMVLSPADKDKKLIFINSAEYEDPAKALMDLTDGHGYDDMFVFSPVKSLVELGDSLLAKDGCMNFFSGPIDKEFAATVNFYRVHYAGTHHVGFTGSLTSDLYEALSLMEKGRLHPAVMVTHIGGLNCVAETTLNLPKIPGGKKLVYTQIDLPLTAIEDFRSLGETDELFAKLADACDKANGLWNKEAEDILLEHFSVDLTK